MSIRSGVMAVMAVAGLLSSPASAGGAASEGASGRWSGLYFGGHVARHRIDTAGTFDKGEAAGPFWISSIGDRGADGGLQAGYNWQWGRLVVGFEADYSMGGFDRSARTVQDGGSTEGGLFGYSIRGDLDYVATARVRAGVVAPAPLGNLLVYVTGGAGFTHFDVNIADGRGRVGFDASGAVYGAGAELALSRSVSVRGEFLRLDFDKQVTLTDVSTSGVFDSDAGDIIRLNSVSVARLALNVKLFP